MELAVCCTAGRWDAVRFARRVRTRDEVVHWLYLKRWALDPIREWTLAVARPHV